MLRKNILSVIIILTMVPVLLYAAENTFPLPPSALSASSSEGSFSSMINPVFSDLDSADNLAYRYVSYDAGHNGNHFASLNIYGFDLIYSRYNFIPDINSNSISNSGVNLYSINRGFFFKNTIGFGAGYSFGMSHDDNFNNYSGWDAGFLFRPFSFISLGVVFRDLGARIGGEKIDYSSVYSISLRPWQEYLTLSADFVKKSKKGIDDKDFYYSGEFKGYKDISFILKYGTDKSITAGLSIPFFVRSGDGTGFILDGYGSRRSENADFFSPGIALRIKSRKEPLQIALSENFIMIDINNNFAVERTDSVYIKKKENTFQDLVRGIEKAGNDQTIKGLIIEIDNPGFGIAQIQEIRDLLKKLRSNGKKVYAILKNSGNKEYYLAAASDKIFFTPNSTFWITGLTAKVYFVKGLLDKGGIKFESFHKGKYKSFSETFTRNDMSKEARENLTEILTDLNEQFISGITADRKLTRADVEELFAMGFYSPEEALKKGFIDGIMYSEEFIKSMPEQTRLLSFEDYTAENEPVYTWGAVPSIAVINVTGSIVSGKGGKTLISASTGDADYRESIELAFDDPDVKAVVIRIDSGGGSAAASDFMWNTLHSARINNPKPVVFSFGNTAASGGYYIACTGDPIYAAKGTITGSIGVVSGKITVEELYSKLGINTETIKMSEFADIFSESRSLTPKEKILMQKNVDFIYDRFTGKVMESRKIDVKDIPAVAEGKVHTGSTAKTKKLIDETGGLAAAIEFARINSNIKSDFRIINLPDNKSLIREIFSPGETFPFLNHMKFIIENMEKYQMLREKTLYIQPYTIDIE